METLLSLATFEVKHFLKLTFRTPTPVGSIAIEINKIVFFFQQEIICHNGSINSLVFTNKGSDLLSGSEDGQLVATTVGSWQPVNIWKKPHTGKAVLKVCLHQSDKFAITLGKDGTLRGWDMLKGTQINTFNTKDMSDARVILDNIELCPGGNTFAASGTKTVVLVSIAGDESYAELTLKSRVTSMCWLNDENLLIGMENGSIEWRNIKTSEHVSVTVHKASFSYDVHFWLMKIFLLYR